MLVRMLKEQRKYAVGIRTMLRAGASVFRNPLYGAISAGSAVVFFGVYLLVPVWLVPGNTLAFELSQITALDYALLATLALMTGILLSFELFAFRRSRTQGLRTAGESGIGLIASLTGGVLAAASCGCGVGILLGVLGLGGGALFVAANQSGIIVAMLVVVAIGLYFSARRAAGLCVTCRVPER